MLEQAAEVSPQSQASDLNITEPPTKSFSKLSLRQRKTCDNKLNSVGSSDLSSDEVDDIGQLREERRDRKRQKRKEKLKKCCSGCDGMEEAEPAQTTLPSPLEHNHGIRPCEVIEPFEKVLSAVQCNSEEEIDAKIEAYSSVGLRLARGDEGLSDVEQPQYTCYPSCDTPSSDSDIVTTHVSAKVGKKLAKRRMISRNGRVDSVDSSNRQDSHSSSMCNEDLEFEGEMWDGFEYDEPNFSSIPSKEEAEEDEPGDPVIEKLTISQLQTLTKHLNFKLQVVNQELVRYIQERDSLMFERDVILRHIEELTSLAQGRKLTIHSSAFRKIVLQTTIDSD